MPPLWLIAGAILIIGLSFVIDRVVLKPRGKQLVVDGTAVSARRKRDIRLLNSFTGSALLILFVVGSALIEGDFVMSALFAIVLAVFVVRSFWLAFRENWKC